MDRILPGIHYSSPNIALNSPTPPPRYNFFCKFTCDKYYNSELFFPMLQIHFAGYRVKKAYKTKLNAYGPACEAEGMNRVPLSINVFRAWHPIAIKHLNKKG